MNQKPDFDSMSDDTLKQYMLDHRDDDEAFYAYVDRVNARPNRTVYPPLKSLEDLEKRSEMLERMKQNSSQS